MNEKVLQKEIQQGLPAPVYLFFGMPFLVEEAAGYVIRALFPDGSDDFNFHVFHGATDPPEEILTTAETLPFMATRRLVMVKQATAFKAAAKKVFERYLLDPAPSTCLVFLAGSPDRRNTFLKFLKEKGAKGLQMTVSENQVPMWLRGRVREKGVRMTSEAERHLLDLVGPDLAVLSRELEKLALSGRKEIDLAQVEEAVGHVREYTPFAIVEAIQRGKMERALRVLKALRDAGQDAVSLLGIIGWHYRQLYKREKIYKREERKKGFKEVFEALHTADLDLKTSGKPDSVILESLLFTLMRKRSY